MVKEAKFYSVLKGDAVKCELCPHFCVLREGGIGKCRVRQNKNQKLTALSYGKPCSISLDPIEKKPLFHFLPGKLTYSLATPGCNLSCLNCQNADISQKGVDEVLSMNVSPEKIVEDAKEKAEIIAYTYTEPTIFYEYIEDIAKLSKGMKNITVTNGFINQKPLESLSLLIDASNIDLKSINDRFYRTFCGAKVEPVLEAIKIMHERGIWIELTNLIIPRFNDSIEDISQLIRWVRDNLGEDVPVHFTGFSPTYKLLNSPATSLSTLRRARKLAMDAGLRYVYTGNMADSDGENTYCPKCNKIIIKRSGFEVIENNLKLGKCQCGEKIPGVWE